MSDLLLEAQLELAIHDIGQRQLYADMLCERGDPRGEFIHLQLLSEPTAEQEARANQLLREHRFTWLGSLAEFVELNERKDPLLGIKGPRYRTEQICLRFSNGFLHSCTLRVKLSAEQTRTALMHPLMATVEVLVLYGGECFEFSRLPQLTHLDFVDKCPDLNELCKLSKLKHLSFRLFQATDLSPLTRMPGLTDLDIGFSRGVPLDLAPLTSLHQLEVLELTRVPDLSLVRGLTNLRSLNTELSDRCDLSPLIALSKLESLTLYSAEITDLSPLADLTTLVTLVFFEPCEDDRTIEFKEPLDFSCLRKLSRLEIVRLGEVSDFSALRRMPSLRKLTIHSKKCNGLGPIANCEMIEELYVDGSPVTSLAPLKNLKRLKELSIEESLICDLSPLMGLLALEKISIRETQVADLSPLSGLTRLRELNIRNTSVSDLGPLTTLCNLEELLCGQSNVSGKSVQELQQALPFLGDENWPTEFIHEEYEDTAERIFATSAQRERGEFIYFTSHTVGGINRLYVSKYSVDDESIVGDQFDHLLSEVDEEDPELELYYRAEDQTRAKERANDYELFLGVSSVYERAEPLRQIEALHPNGSPEDLAWRDRRALSPDPYLTGESTTAFLSQTLLYRLEEYLEESFAFPAPRPENTSWKESTWWVYPGDKEHPTTISFHYITDSKMQDAILDWLHDFFATLGFPYLVCFYRARNLMLLHHPVVATATVEGPKEVLREYNPGFYLRNGR